MRKPKRSKREKKTNSGGRSRFDRSLTQFFGNKSIFGLFGRFILVLIGLLFFLLITIRVIDPPLTPLMIIRSLQGTWNGTPVTRTWHWVSYEAIPLHVREAVVAAEDARFMQHQGIDLLAMESAMSSRSARARGASTITMQTVKNIFFWPGRSYIRKGLELCITPFADFIWGKRRTLELYLNIAEWGNGVYGIDAAARHHFGKSARQLSGYEAALLASILPNPRKFSPRSLNPSSRRRLERIVREMRTVETPRE